MIENDNNNIYIMPLEAAEIYEHMHRDKELLRRYVGMIPFSSELEQLHEQKLKVFNSKRYNKKMTNDIINVKFKQKVKSAEEIIKLKLKRNKGIKDEKKRAEIDKEIEELKAKKDWIAIKVDDEIDKDTNQIKTKGLRTLFYENGFTLEIDDKKIEYVVYKRSSAKSRTGQVLFIRKALRDKMIKWARMGMDLEGRNDVDYPSLLAYESLVSSNIEGYVEINPDNILIVDDVKSIFPIDCNVVEKDENGKLVSKPANGYMMKNDIFDGEGLLQSDYFDKCGRSDKGMILTRQHMFKSCLFNTNIQKFFMDYAEENSIDFDTWKLTNMFNQPIFAKDVHCIITSASLKALKFSNIKGSRPKMWEHWKKKVANEKCMFGIVKSDKPSKRGEDKKGNILQQTSYQMLNSMPISHEEMKELSKYEYDYILKLKNDDDVYIEYLRVNANRINANNMLVDLYERNKSITGLELFKNKRKKDIHKYVNHVKKGKIRLPGDYLTIMGNGKELLYHAICRLPVDKDGVLDYEAWKNQMILKDNEVYTTLCDFDFEYTCFRNPHTSQSNVLVVKNKNSSFIAEYFNLSGNIIYTNAINFPIQRILSGQDLDSDTLVLFMSCKLLELAKKCYVGESNYRVCVNNIEPSPNTYTVNDTDKARIDNILAKSQRVIGEVVNLGQFYMSTYWDLVNRDYQNARKLNELLMGVDICTILSEISIDQAKRIYDIDIEEQIKNLRECSMLGDKKPLFFKFISRKKAKTKYYKTSMDYLQKILENLPDADDKDIVDIKKLLNTIDARKVKHRQVKGIVRVITKMSNKIKNIEAKYPESKELNKSDKKEKYRDIDYIINEFMHKVKVYKIKVETIYAILCDVFSERLECKYKLDLLNALYKANKEVFLNTFKTTEIIKQYIA